MLELLERWGPHLVVGFIVWLAAAWWIDPQTSGGSTLLLITSIAFVMAFSFLRKSKISGGTFDSPDIDKGTDQAVKTDNTVDLSATDSSTSVSAGSAIEGNVNQEESHKP